MKELLDSILVVEDEPLIAEDICDTLNEAGYGVAGIAHNANDAIRILKNNAPSLALLDINIDGHIDGLMLAGMINEDYEIPIIFLTSYTDPQTLKKIADLKAYGYIVKPFNEKELTTNIGLAIARHKENSRSLGTLEEQSTTKDFFIKKDHKLQKVSVTDILYAQAFDNYTYLITDKEKFLVPLTLKKVNEKVNSEKFFRVHRSYVVNLDKITEITEDAVVLKTLRLPLSRNSKSGLLKRVDLL